ncbi:MAG: hypothetical protein ABJC09_01465 [Terriglobia bacterium]
MKYEPTTEPAYAAHRAGPPGEISGLPHPLPAGVLAALVENGTAIALAGGNLLEIYRVSSGQGHCGASEEASYALPGRACGLAESNLGIVVAVVECELSTVYLARDCRLVKICDLPGTVTDLVAAGSQAYAVVRTGMGLQGRLVQIDLRQREITLERALDNWKIKLSIDLAGQQIVIADAAANQVTCVGPGLQPPPAVPPPPSVGYAPPASRCGCEKEPAYPKDVHPRGCCCAVCQSAPSGGGPQGPQLPGGGSGQQPPAGTGQGPGQTGQTGVPGTGGGTVVGNGSTVGHNPPKGLGTPCDRNLFWTVATLQRAGAYFLAADRSGQRVALLSSDMNLLDEWKFGRGGAMLLAAESSPSVVMYMRSSGKWLLRETQAAVALRPGLQQYAVQPQDSKTFIGQPPGAPVYYTMSYGQGGAPTSINAVVLPVIEKDQKFSSPDLSGFGAFLHRTVEATVRDYYQENSFGILKDVSVKVFGLDVGPVGGPLILPRNKLADYFYPDYLPARVELNKSGVFADGQLVFDGRESLTLDVQPLTGGPAGGSIKIPFYALAFQPAADFTRFPVQVKFLGTETLALNVTTPAGAAAALNLIFPPKTFDMPDLASVPAQSGGLRTYLDDVMKAAEVAAGIAIRLFTPPNVSRIGMIGDDFGRLLVTFNAADTGGKKLSIQSATASLPGGDPLGLASPLLGTMTYGDTVALSRYFENAALLGQEANPAFGYTNRMLELPACVYTVAPLRLTTTFAISSRFGGPGATVNMPANSGLGDLFDTSVAQPNSATTVNNQHAVRDLNDLLTDAYTNALQALSNAGQPIDTLKGFGTVLVVPVEPPTPALGVMAAENWKVTDLYRPFNLRGVEWPGTIVDRNNKDNQLQVTWALTFIRNNAGDLNVSVFCHELGHALGFGDLYFATGYRDELRYMDDWAMMANDPPMSHHCGYHKLQANWIPDGAGTLDDFGRVYPFGLPLPSDSLTKEVLLVPLELWRDSLTASARAAFGVGGDFPVAQLVYIDFGGDGSTFGLVEAREHAKNSAGHLHFSKQLPGDGGILITNAIAWKLDERFAVNDFYRRSLQLLNADNILRSKGDAFDLALAPELPVKGMKVEVLDRKTVEGDTEVYHLKLTRENADFIDLYFDAGDPYYESPDLWIDWWGNNQPKPENLNPDYPLGQPTDQGETVFVPNKGTEPHWVVARVRNRGKVDAIDVQLNFYYLEPPGAGDGKKPLDTRSRKDLKLIGSPKVPVTVAGGDVPQKLFAEWDIPPGFSGHTCILVEIVDYKIPRDSKGAALGSDDMWQVNNHAQKNVDKFQALSGSPFTPVEFDFGVYNGGVGPELAYLEPDALPYGMTLTVTPPEQVIAANTRAIFHFKLELNEQIIRTGCENDRRFRINAWRKDSESSARWGGVEYEVQPREKTVATLRGSWSSSDEVELTGTIVPNPGGGSLRIRQAFDNQQAVWRDATLMPNGTFAWSGHAPAGSSALDAVAWFEGNRKFGASRSAPVDLSPPPPIR